MKEIKVMPKFKCDFCKKRAIKRVMSWHEPSCFRNPNRICFLCENRGTVDVGDDYGTQVPCPACEKFDPKIIKLVEHYEKTGEKTYSVEGVSYDIF